MKVYALVGVSGTGKSTRATTLADELEIQLVIDDGILIYNGKKLAGYSAKYEKTSIAAVKRAVFHHAQHQKEVQNQLSRMRHLDILILGTSQHMVDLIAERLQLPAIHSYIPVQEVMSEKEVNAALFNRKTYGKHTIPVSPIEVHKDLASKIISHVEQIFSKKQEQIGERTIVYPRYQKSRIFIYEKALKKIVTLSIKDHPNLRQILKIHVTIDSFPTVIAELSLQLPYQHSIPPIAKSMEQNIRARFNHVLNIDLYTCQIKIMDIHITAT